MREVDGYFLPRGIAAGDIDGFIESHGHVLVIETKKRDVEMDKAQRMAYEALSRLGVTVLQQECDPPNEDAVTRYRVCRAGIWTAWRPADRLERDRWIRLWCDETKVEVAA